MAREQRLREGRAVGTLVEGAPYPHVERRRRPNPQLKPPRVVRPAAKPKLLREPSRPATVGSAGDPDPHGNRDPVVFHGYRRPDPLNKSLTDAADMSGADTERDVVMLSGNWYCDVSTDGGGSWKRLDPTTVFPNTLAGGFCCDQVVTYVPSIDHFVWLLQYQKDGAGQGAFRLATASSTSVHDDATRWTYWDFVAGDFGFPTTDMDYPDLAFSSQFLYVATDVFGAGRLVVRIPLKQIAAAGSIDCGYTDASLSANQWGAHLVQQTRSQAVWAGHKDTSTLEVFTMPDAGTTYSSFTVPVAAWPHGTYSSTGPDGNDWLTKLDDFPNSGITGGVERANGHVVLAWTATKGKGSSNGFDFPQAHCRVVELDLGNRSVVSEMQVWNPDYAFAYPNLAVNGRDEVGIILGWGGPHDHANCAMGIIGDFVVWYQDGSTRTVKRFGDYLTTRRAQRNGNRFAGFGYYVTDVAGHPDQCDYHPIYVRYGRAST